MSDEHLYAQVVTELRTSGPVAGLWAKCYADAVGDDGKARALYLTRRVDQLQVRDQRAREAAARLQEHQRQASPEAKRFTPIHGVLLGLVVLFVVLAAAKLVLLA